LWTAEGWPVVSPERYAGEKEQDIPKRLLSGNWERIVIKQEVDGQVEAEQLRLEDGGRATSGSLEGHWSFDGRRTLTMDWSNTSEGTKEELLLLPSWDWELGRHTLIFTGMNEKGISIWGKRISD
jgi:arabinan endo-1,5-alpha-L-arabinosidase